MHIQLIWPPWLTCIHVQMVESPQPVLPPASAPMWMASKWLAMNVLMLDPKRVVVSDTQKTYHKMFESLGIECIKVLLNTHDI